MKDEEIEEGRKFGRHKLKRLSVALSLFVIGGLSMLKEFNYEFS